MDVESGFGDRRSRVEGKCVIVLPCFNEASRLAPALFLEFLAEHNRVDLLFVNDGSRDQTLAVLEALRTRCPDRISILDKQLNGGKAEAVREGMLTAMEMEDVSYTGFWDADLATPLYVVSDLLEHMVSQPGLSMILGSRVRLLGRSINRRPVRHYLGRCFATAASVVLELPIYDTQCGAKLFRCTPQLQMILSSPFESKWIFDVEIIARFLLLNRTSDQVDHHGIYEYPLPSWQDVEGSKVGPLDFVKAFYQLLRIRAMFRLGKS